MNPRRLRSIFLLAAAWLSVRTAIAERVAPVVQTVGDSLSVSERMQSYFNDLNDFNRRYPQEKVYLHFDNTAYFLTEAIWFKAYVVQASNHVPSQLSGVLYVELLSPEGGVLETRKLPIENGCCHGEFYLDSLYLSGYYEVRAYTRYMLNFGEDAYFSRVFPVYKNVTEGEYFRKTILDRDLSRRKRVNRYREYGDYSLWSYIVSPSKRLKQKYYFEPLPKWDSKKRRSEVLVTEAFDEEKKRREIPISVSFYPEGGVLVQGVEQNIAFSIVDQTGRGLNVSGSITDSRGRELTHLVPLMDGSGIFSLTPALNEKYYARIRYQRKWYSYPLPSCYSSGCALSLRTSYDSDSMDIETHYVKDELFNDSLVAVALSHGGQIYQFFIIESMADNRLRVPKKDMPEGVNTITVFDKEGRALSQRMCFIRHPSANQTLMRLNELSDMKGMPIPDPYGKIALDWLCTDSAGQPLQCSFSLTVRDKETDDITYNTDNFYTWLLLSSELKGYIKQASYYFEKDDRIHQLHLDLLMLTRGWCRYQWENMNDRFKSEGWTQPIENRLLVDGGIYNLDNRRKPRLRNADLGFSFITDTIEYYGRITTNDIGNYAVMLPPFYGSGRLWLNMTDYDLRRSHMVSLNRWFSPSPRPISYYELNVPVPDMSIGSESASYQRMDSLLHFTLRDVSITRKSLRRHIHYQYSMRHYNVAEELEYMLDTYKIPLGSYIRHPDSLVLSIMDRYNFPPCAFNTVFATEYESDVTLPKGKLYWQTYKYRQKIFQMKELVIRSDSDVLSTFFLPKGKDDYVTESTDPDLEWSPIFMGEKTVINKNPTRFRLVKYGSEDEQAAIPYDRRPDCVAFFIPINESEMRPELPEVMGQRRTRIQGYSYSKEFVHPDYSHTALPDLPADYRRTLYWNPDVKTDSTGVAHIEFYNNSTCRFLSISAEGITSDGTPVVYEK